MFKKSVISIVLALALIVPFGIISVTQQASALALYVDHAQGEIAGEVTTDSVILQSRLTLIGSPLIGTNGVGRFEISTDPDFNSSFMTDWIETKCANDYMIQKKVTGLQPGTQYYYRLIYGPFTCLTDKGQTCTFRTLDTPDTERETSFTVVTGMNYFKFYLFPGPTKKYLGYPGLETIMNMNPDFFVATGDNVYYDAFAVPRTTQAGMRTAWHQQFIQPRFIDLFSKVQTYWEKDDHDFRYNDADPYCAVAPSPELGKSTFLEQVPVVDPDDPDPITYRTYRINKLLQIWLVENRDYRSSNMMEPGPDKTIWGETQKAWLKQTLSESDATFKILISPTPMIGPDETTISWPSERLFIRECQDDYKRDNQTNPMGFKYEGEEFFSWLADNGFIDKNFYIICGDRHWKYHSIRPDGFEEFSCGALCDANSKLGVIPGDPESTDPDGLINQPFTDPVASGGFIQVKVKPADADNAESCQFNYFDENGVLLYTQTRFAD